MSFGLKAESAASFARKVNAINELNIDAADLLFEAQSLSESTWEGEAAEAFKIKVIEIIKDINILTGEIIAVSNKITTLADQYVEQEVNSSDASGGGGGFSGDSGLGGGGGGGGSF